MYSGIFFNRYSVHWDEIQTLQTFSLNIRKNSLIFLTWSSAHHSSILYFRFLYELKHKVSLSKRLCGSFHLWFRFVFGKKIFFHSKKKKKKWTLTLNVIIPVKIKIIENPHAFAPRPFPDTRFYSQTLGVTSRQNWPFQDEFFRLNESKFWELQFCSSIIFITFLYLLNFYFLIWSQKHPVKEHRLKFETAKLNHSKL